LSHHGTDSFPKPAALNGNPFISIVVPTRNRPELLGRMLAAIRSQRFAAFEVIVIDDGSSAATRAAYGPLWQELDDRFKRIEMGHADAPGLGPSVARNCGIEAATGTVLAFCDDDDFWTNDDHLTMMADVFGGCPDVDLYIANQSAVSAAGVVERRDWLPDLVRLVEGKRRDHAHGYRLRLAELVRGGGFAQLNILAVRMTTARAVGGFWPRTSYEEDRDFFWRAADAARGVFFNPTLVAQHNVPDPNGQANLSRRFSQAERYMLSAMVSQHVAISVRSPLVRRLCEQYEGDILRHLSQYFSKEGKHALASQYARRALAARLSFKWALYTGVLMCRQLMRRKMA
jgi:glycosyltransferase involved in cell wall biosynthesis